MIKGLKEVSNATQATRSANRASWIDLYYSISQKEVFTEPGPGRCFITSLINPNSAEDIAETVNEWLNVF